MKTEWKKLKQMYSHARSDDEEVIGGRSRGFNRIFWISGPTLKSNFSKLQCKPEEVYAFYSQKIAVILTNNIEMLCTYVTEGTQK